MDDLIKEDVVIVVSGYSQTGSGPLPWTKMGLLSGNADTAGFGMMHDDWFGLPVFRWQVSVCLVVVCYISAFCTFCRYSELKIPFLVTPPGLDGLTCLAVLGNATA